MKVITTGVLNNSFKADAYTIDPKTGTYKDPLMHWPLRGAAFTNEVGEALRPLIGNYATLSWAPALLYIGADVYDKYKNDQTEYSPNSKRAFKQALFQGLASILLPIFAVKTGQNLFSLFGYASSEQISFNTKDNINKIAEEFVANGNMHAYKKNEPECIAKFKDNVLNRIDYRKNKDSCNNKISRWFLSLEEKLFKKHHDNKNKNTEKYAETTIKELIELRKNLLQPSEDFKLTNHYKDYLTKLKNGQTRNVAVKSVLNKYLHKKSLTSKIIKTCGGFLALGLAIKPIDYFVEHVLLGKVLAQGFESKKVDSKKDLA